MTKELNNQIFTYDEFMLIEDIKTALMSDDNCRIKIACIESYFNVYETLKQKNEVKNEQ